MLGVNGYICLIDPLGTDEDGLPLGISVQHLGKVSYFYGTLSHWHHVRVTLGLHYWVLQMEKDN